MTMPMRFWILVALILGTAAPGAQGPPHATRTFSSPSDYGPDPRKPGSTSELRDLVDRFNDDRAAILRFYTIPGSPTRRERMRAFYDTWLKTLAGVNFDALSQEGKVDYVLLRTRIEYEHGADRAARIASSSRSRRCCRSPPDIVTLAGEPAAARLHHRRRGGQGAGGASRRRSSAASRRRPRSGATCRRRRRFAPRRKWTRSAAALTQWFNFFNGYDPAFTAGGAAGRTRRCRRHSTLRRDAAREDRRAAARCAAGSRRRTRRGGRGGGRAADRARQRRADRRRSDRPRRPVRGSARRDDRLHAGTADRDRRSRVRVVRGRDEEGVARDGLRRRLEEGAREGQEHLRAARRAAAAGPRPRARRRSRSSSSATWSPCRRSPRINGA